MKISYKSINDQMIAQMEAHGSNWINPMRSQLPAGLPRNAITGTRYNGINLWLLGLTNSHWATYNAWEKAGYQVAKGEKSTRIIWFKTIVKEDKVSGETESFGAMKTFSVFRSDQLDSDVKAYVAPEQISYRDETQANSAVDSWVANTGIAVKRNNDGKAFYSPTNDLISIPHRSGFTSTETSTASEAHDSTLLHELTHATGHKSRLDRLKSGGFGSNNYSFEELVAELGAAYQCAILGVSAAPRADHAQYLNSWIKGMKDDHRAFFKASSLAQKAIEWIESQQIDQEVAA